MEDNPSKKDSPKRLAAQAVIKQREANTEMSKTGQPPKQQSSCMRSAGCTGWDVAYSFRVSWNDDKPRGVPFPSERGVVFNSGY